MKPNGSHLAAEVASPETEREAVIVALTSWMRFMDIQELTISLHENKVTVKQVNWFRTTV